jgi:eukaryotic-like serine/threonine-protein kinase
MDDDLLPEIFGEALSLPAEHREAFVRKKLGEDEVSIRNVLDALRAHTPEPAGLFKESKAGDAIGPYRLLNVLGEGGCGKVWLAEQTRPVTRQVALKILHPGMNSMEVLARFEQERQALAMMEHPFIAKVFDAGVTPSGLPYFVMEYVKGEPITHYADRHTLGVRQRLALFASVCDAVQHAHIKGVIHRDIKPSNVLVSFRDGELRPKVIDFGVAKAIRDKISEKTIFTETGQLVGTPAYMSPEQAGGLLDIDTRTDVYSLGVLLYELLTGTTPFSSKELRSAAYAEIQRIIREVEPPKPSTRLSNNAETLANVAALRQIEPKRLGTLVRGEVDWIVMRALEKDRLRRYETPSGLAADIQRYLSGEAVVAAPPSNAYRAKKFVKRNKGPVAAAAAVVFALVMGLAGTLWQAREAQQQAAAAREAEQAQKRLAEDEAAARKTAEAKTAEAIAAARTIEWNAYVANIEMAAAWLDQRQFDRVRQRLDACPPHLRGWEWGWLNACADTSLVELNGHTEDVDSAAFSPDGTRIVTVSMDGTARVWDANTGASLAELNGHTSLVTSAAFSPDGTRIVTASMDGTARVWEAANGGILAELNGHTAQVTSAAFSPDGTRIVTASMDGTARVWDVTTGASLAELKGHMRSRTSVVINPDQTGAYSIVEGWLWLTSAAFSPDGTRIVTASADNTARVWDATTGASLAELRGHTDFVWSAAFSPDGKRIVTASADNTARVWDAKSSASVAELKGHKEGVNSATFSPGGTRIVTVSADNTARVWDAKNGASIAELKGHTARVTSAAFSPDGARIVTASWDGTARAWDATTGASLVELNGHTAGVNSAAFSPDGTRIVTASGDNTARVWETSRGGRLVVTKGHGEAIRSVAFSADGARIVTASLDGSARVWDTANGVLSGGIHQQASGLVSAAFSPDGTRIMTVAENGTGRVWDIQTWAMLLELAASVKSAAFSPDGTRIVTASWDGTARVLDPTTGAIFAELKGHTDPVNSAFFSPDGTRIVTASWDSTARIWNSLTGSDVELRGHSEILKSAAFSRDGRLIVTASNDGTARVWDSNTGARLVELRGHKAGVESAAFSPDGTRIVTASSDGTARVWHTDTGASLVEMSTGGYVTFSAAFSPDGSLIVAASADGTIHVWDSVPYRERFNERGATPP